MKEHFLTEMKEHVLTSHTWIRGFWMFLFAIVYYVASMVAFALVMFQWAFLLFTGKLNERLLPLGQSLSTYLYQILLYLTYNHDEKPFPFQDWPTPKNDLISLSKEPINQHKEGPGN